MLQVPEFRYLLAGHVVSGMGQYLHLAAAAWLTLEATGSPAWVGMVTASMHAPRLLLSLPAGAWADRIDRRRLLLRVQLANAVVAAALALATMLGSLTPGLLLVGSFLIGSGATVTMPAYQSSVSDVLPGDAVHAAVTLNSALYNVARAFGPALAGLLLADGREEAAFLVVAGAFAVVALLVRRLPGSTTLATPERLRRSISTGLRYTRFTPQVLGTLTMAAAFAMTAASLETLLPSIAQDQLRLEAEGFGLLAGSFGVGAVVAAALRDGLQRLIGRRSLISPAVCVFGIAGMLVGLQSNAALASALVALAGAGMMLTGSTMNANLQLSAPAWVRGRTLSMLALGFLGLWPVGSLLAGVVAESVGAGQAVMILCGLTTLVGLVSFRFDFGPGIGSSHAASPPTEWAVPSHPSKVHGSPVIITTMFHVQQDDLDHFLDLMSELRRHRLRTGATRWFLLRGVDDELRLTELFEVPDWGEHLRQHERLTVEMVRIIRAVRELHDDGDPLSHHLAAVDVSDPTAVPSWEDLRVVHDQLHSRDGSFHVGRPRSTTE